MRLGILPKVDGYIIRQTVTIFLLCTVVLCFLVAVVDAFQQMDEFREYAKSNDVDVFTLLGSIGLYYICLTSQYLLQHMVPFVLLISGAIVASQMSSNREFTALRASGVPLQRVLLPIPLVALTIGLGVFLVRDHVLPMLAREANVIATKIRPRKSQPITIVIHKTDEQHPGEDVMETLNIGHFDAENRIAHAFRLERQKLNKIHSANAVDMTSYDVFSAGEAKLTNAFWMLSDHPSHVRKGRYHLRRTDLVDPISTTVTSAMLEQQAIGPAVMTAADLEAMSYDLDKQIELARRRAAPFAGALVLLVGLPLVVRRELSAQGSVGLVMGVILALLVCSGFYVFQEFCTGLAMSEWLWPNVAVWIPNLFFGVWGGIWFRRANI